MRKNVVNFEDWTLNRLLKANPLFDTRVWKRRFLNFRALQHSVRVPVQMRLPFEAPANRPRLIGRFK